MMFYRSLLFVLWLLPLVLLAQDDEEKLEDKVKQTRHSIVLEDGTELHYRATAGTMTLRDQEDERDAKASLFYTAYTVDGPQSDQERPLTFVFNGGPGSASIWLHLGALGPKRVNLGDGINPPPPPYHLVNNPYTCLDLTDLVFIDPISTGYSRSIPGEDPKQFHGVEEDLNSIGQFIRLYLSRNQRWGSPLYLLGESYGTARAAGLALHLNAKEHINLSGVILVSTILQWHGYSELSRMNQDLGHDLPYVLTLPSLSASAWYHKRLPNDGQGKSLEVVVQEAREFASRDYLLALMQGDDLDANTRQNIAERLSELTGLSMEFVLQSNLRLTALEFGKELLRSEGLTIGRFDARVTGHDRDKLGRFFERDPSGEYVMPAYTHCFNQYVRKDLDWQDDSPYIVLSSLALRNWNFDNFQARFPNFADDLKDAMLKNPHLKVLSANGYYDLATRFFATEYTFSHMDLPKELRKQISLTYYEGGHMFYHNIKALKQFKSDLIKFYR